MLTEHLRVAVECEKYGKNKKREAVKDATSRLVPIQRVDLALAVVYPKECKYEDDLSPGSLLTFAVIHRSDAVRYGDVARHTRSVRWSQCAAGDFGIMINNLYRDIGEPEQIANDLKQRLDEAVNQFTPTQRRNLAKTINYSGEKINEAAKRALLVVASAALFHARLGDHLDTMEPTRRRQSKKWPPKTLGECSQDKNDLRDAWKTILDVDYTPIFETASQILAKNSGVQFAAAIRSMAEWALNASDRVEGLRHDLLGLIFHAVLDTARHDGSFYTTTPAAVLLANIAIRDRNDLPSDIRKMKVMDPACGTGTLLMAAAERMRDILGAEYDPNVLVENVLCGVDVNVTAAHMAATTIGLLSPDTRFDRMEIWIADLGVKDGMARAGSLEMYAPEGILPYVDWYGDAQKQVETGVVSHRAWKHTADLVIMNPPFTRNDLRHDQFGKNTEEKIKKREGVIFSKCPRGLRYSSDPMFMVLAEHLNKESGVVAVVRPMVTATSPSSKQIRLFLAQKYHVDTIIAPHDPNRFYFSASTNIAEILIVLRREPPKNTRIVNLSVNPGTVAEAASLARAINEGTPSSAQVIEWPRERVQKGDWSGILFYSPYLVEQSTKIRDGSLFKTAPLEEISRIGELPRGVRMNFNTSDKPDKHARFVRYDHKTDDVTSLRATPNKYLTAKLGREKQAENSWSRGGLLHVPEHVRLNITHALAIRTDHKSIGTSWYPIIPTDEDPEIWSKAMAVYLNSTIGVIAMLGARIPRILEYPRYGVDDVKTIPLPIMSKGKLNRLASVYDKHKDADLGVLKNPNPLREKLDLAVCKVLNLDTDMVSTMRRELSREPMITGKRYDSVGIDDFQ